MSAPWLDDGDVQLYHGDAIAMLDALPAGVAQTCVTSPPYWGLRDYGTDGQIGLESSPDEYVTRMVSVFRAVRRVLRDDGTLWLNLGDSYAHSLRQAGNAYAGAKQNTSAGSIREGYKPLPIGLKEKDLVGIPWRVAFALQQPWYDGTIRSELDRVWLAAMIDAEGCMYLHRRRAGQSNGQGYLRKADSFGAGLEVANTSEAVVQRCLAITGRGSIVRQEKDRRQPLYRWTLRSNECRDVIREVYPYLVAKQHEARLVLGCPSSGSQAEAAWLAVKSLHSGGAPDIDFKPPESCHQPGWYLRSCIVWSKANPMPESVTDRPTTSHEYVFLLSKQPRYFYDADAVREPHVRLWDSTKGGNLSPDGEHKANGSYRERGGDYPLPNPAGRNLRSVWSIATRSTPEAHFATYPEELVRRCIFAGSSSVGQCRKCDRPVLPSEYGIRPSTDTPQGMPAVRNGVPAEAASSAVLLSPLLTSMDGGASGKHEGLRHRPEGLQVAATSGASDGVPRGIRDGASPRDGEPSRADADSGRSGASQERRQGGQPSREPGSDAETVARSEAEAADQANPVSALRRSDHREWSCPTCGCGDVVPQTILDPFVGSGTTALVARKHGRRAVGIDLNAEYLKIAARRLGQQSLFAEAAS